MLWLAMNKRSHPYHTISWFDSFWSCRNACARTKDGKAQSREQRGWERHGGETASTHGSISASWINMSVQL